MEKRNRDVRIYAVNNKNKDGFNVYADISGRRVYMLSHRHNYHIYQLLKDGLSLDELRRGKLHRIYARHRVAKGQIPEKIVSSLEHLIRVVEYCIQDEFDEVS